MNPIEATLLDLADVSWPEFVAIPEAKVLTGTPETSTVVITESQRGQMGLWQVTPGSFTTDHTGYIEYIHILSGTGRLVSETGTVTELGAGSTTVMPVGWKGRWEIDTTLTKVFTILHCDADEFTIHTLEPAREASA